MEKKDDLKKVPNKDDSMAIKSLTLPPKVVTPPKPTPPPPPPPSKPNNSPKK